MERKNDGLTRKNIVNQENFIVKKKFSQNFLLDENIINNIIEKAGVDNETGVIEIGPGLGALTKVLINRCKKLLIYEIDTDLIPYLEEFFSEYDNYKLINQDILKTNTNKDIESYLLDVNKIVVISNLPYHITTPIIMKFLEEVNNIESLTLMMQLEVAKRITSKPNTKDYNALSVIIQHQTEAKYLFKVPKNVFFPKPNVDSAVIKLTIKKEINNNEHKELYRFVHSCFSQRRKTLVNNLSQVYKSVSKEEMSQILEELGYNQMVRAESLELKDFVSLFNKLQDKQYLK